MYKVVIADDEQMIRDGLKSLSLWEELGFEVIHTCSDGDELIEYLEYMPVDVVLTDIRMLRVDGIEVAKYVQESQKDCKVVFISGHKEFELAVQGIKYGVQEYILKPIESDKMREVFRKLKEELDAEQTRKESKRKMDSFLEEKFVYELIMGGLDNEEYIRQYMKLMYPDIDDWRCPCMLLNMEIEQYQDFLQNTWHYSVDQFSDALASAVGMADEEVSYHIVYKNQGNMKIFAILKRLGESKAETERLCREKAEALAVNLRDLFRIDISMGVEVIFPNIYQVPEGMEQVLTGHERMKSVELHLWEQKRLVMSNLMMGNIHMAQKILHNILKNLPKDTPGACGHFLVDIFSGISQFLQENDLALFQKVQPFINYELMLNLKTEEKMCSYCDRVFNKIKEASDGQMDMNHLIHQVKMYIQENIFEDISQADIAEKLFLSPPYLSRLFKTQTGENFQQYVTKKKMEKAVELLQDPQYRVYQVGELLGYKQPRYFSKLFYNYIGYYPNQYRREILNMGETKDEGE